MGHGGRPTGPTFLTPSETRSPELATDRGSIPTKGIGTTQCDRSHPRQNSTHGYIRKALKQKGAAPIGGNRCRLGNALIGGNHARYWSKLSFRRVPVYARWAGPQVFDVPINEDTQRTHRGRTKNTQETHEKHTIGWPKCQPVEGSAWEE